MTGKQDYMAEDSRCSSETRESAHRPAFSSVVEPATGGSAGAGIAAEWGDPAAFHDGSFRSRWRVFGAECQRGTAGHAAGIAICPSKHRCTHALVANASATDCRSFCFNAETLYSLAQGSVAGDQA